MDERRHDIQHTGTLPVSGTDTVPVAPPPAPRGPRPPWVDDARSGLDAPGRYLAYEEGGRHVVLPIRQDWTRIGRSLSAEVRFDDATVSRRHAQVVVEGGSVRVLDDRSLNGIAVNGRRVESAPLRDGDELSIGRHTLFFLDTAAAGEPLPAAGAAAAD